MRATPNLLSWLYQLVEDDLHTPDASNALGELLISYNNLNLISMICDASTTIILELISD